MLRRHVALGDGEEAREPRLGSQEIVAVVVERTFVDQIADRQQLPVGIEQEAELRRQRHRPRRVFENGQPFLPDGGRLGRPREILCMSLNRTRDRARPEQHIRARLVVTFYCERAGAVDHDLDGNAKVGELGWTIDLRRRRLLQARDTAASASSS